MITEELKSEESSTRNSELKREKNNSNCDSTKANMSALYFTLVLFCIFMTATQACFSCPSCPKTDLQRDFCAASFGKYICLKFQQKIPVI